MIALGCQELLATRFEIVKGKMFSIFGPNLDHFVWMKTRSPVCSCMVSVLPFNKTIPHLYRILTETKTEQIVVISSQYVGSLCTCFGTLLFVCRWISVSIDHHLWIAMLCRSALGDTPPTHIFGSQKCAYTDACNYREPYTSHRTHSTNEFI